MKVLACLSGIGHGHVGRCRPLLEALAREGHEVTVALTGFAAGRTLADDFEVIPPPDGYRDRVAPRVGSQPAFMVIPSLTAVLAAYQRDAAEGLRATVEFFDGVIEAGAPDLVIVDQVLGVSNLAAARGVPVVQVTHAPFLPGFGRWNHWEDRDPRIIEPELAEVVTEAFDAVGVPIPEDPDSLILGDRYLVPTLPAFGSSPHATHIRPKSVDFGVGSAAGRVVLYISLGSPELIRATIEGTLQAGRDAVVVGGTAAEQLSGVFPEDRVEIAPFTPLEQVLGGAVAIVHRGGSGVAQEALVAGVPQILIPRNTEQETSARTVRELGAGLYVPVSELPMEPVEVGPGFTTLGHREPRQLEERIAAALGLIGDDPSFRSSAFDHGQALLSLPPIREVAGEVEALAGVGR